LIPVDASEAERSAKAVLLREAEFGPWLADQTEAMW
jgi:hypothetical protein